MMRSTCRGNVPWLRLMEGGGNLSTGTGACDPCLPVLPSPPPQSRVRSYQVVYPIRSYSHVDPYRGTGRRTHISEQVRRDARVLLLVSDKPPSIPAECKPAALGS